MKKCQYCESPAIFGNICRRVTLRERFRKWRIDRRWSRETVDVFQVTNFYRSGFSGK